MVLSFKDPIPFNVEAIITSITEVAKLNFDPKKIVTFEKDPNSTINTAVRILKGKTRIRQIVIGIDPGRIS